MEWYDSYSIGIENIDKQHKELVGLVHKLKLALKKESTDADLAKALCFLVDYTKRHFSDEEAVMLKIDFPNYDNHLKQHTKFIRDVTDMLLIIKKGRKISMYELIDFLTEWVLNHIKYEDQKIGRYYLKHKNEQGIEPPAQ